mmetsp:Transcript_63913/g.192940  ORF Transcript_63913/g.192940 Transcript_63913/m.192940 type:complete len:274 (+) Transcript_63913:891-1712(+)
MVFTVVGRMLASVLSVSTSLSHASLKPSASSSSTNRDFILSRTTPSSRSSKSTLPVDVWRESASAEVLAATSLNSMRVVPLACTSRKGPRETPPCGPVSDGKRRSMPWKTSSSSSWPVWFARAPALLSSRSTTCCKTWPMASPRAADVRFETTWPRSAPRPSPRARPLALLFSSEPRNLSSGSRRAPRSGLPMRSPALWPSRLPTSSAASSTVRRSAGRDSFNRDMAFLSAMLESSETAFSSKASICACRRLIPSGVAYFSIMFKDVFTWLTM